ncbi:MAG: TrmB family transcriptional regulator [Candidatus Nanoarchaeia archaeon]
MDISQLESIGLKEKEAKVYISLLKHGESLANSLAKETEILRSSIYDYLDVLIEKGFVSYTIKSGKKYFHAVDPSKILNNFEEEKKRQEQALKEIVPKLSELQNISENKAKVEVFEGKEGLKSVFSYILKDNPKEVLVYGSSGVSHKLLPFFMEHWHNQRIKQKIHIKIIYSDVPESKERIKSGPPMKFMDIKFMPIKNFSLTGTMIYDNKVLITMWNSQTPLAISIESEDIAKQYKDNFEVLWKISKK